ncbi:hypothetical protein EI555_017147, partial [Monodon monoceros]
MDPPPARAPIEAPPRPGCPGARPAAPCPALRYLGAPERAELGPTAAPHLLPALAPGPVAAQGRTAWGRPRRQRAWRAGRTQAPEPAARGSTSSRSAPQLRRRRRRRRAAQWERAGGDSPRPGRPGPHARAPAGPHLPRNPFSGAPRVAEGGCTHHLAFSLLSPQEPWRRPLRRRQPLQPWEL